MITLLVGSHFARPAMQLLPHLANGTRCTLRPEPENPYDPNAILVTVQKGAFDPLRVPAIEEAILGHGLMWEELPEDIVLGHVAASGGKPLAKATQTYDGRLGPLVGTLEVLGHTEGRLVFDAASLVLVEVRDNESTLPIAGD